MTRVAYYIVTPGFGGMELHLLSLLRALDRARFEPVVFVRCDDPAGRRQLLDALAELRVPIRDLDDEGLPLPAASTPTRRRRMLPNRFGAAKRWLLARLPATVKRVWYASKCIRAAARVLRVERLDLIHFLHGAYPSLELAVIAARVAKIPVRVSDIRSEPWDIAQWQTLRRFWARRAVRAATRVIVLSARMREQARQRCGIPDERVVTISTAEVIELEPFLTLNGQGRHLRDRLGLSDCRVVTLIGRLSTEKGPDLFIKAAARVAWRHPRARFLLVGDGPLRPQLEALVHQRGLDAQVRFMGYQQDVAAFLGASDLVVIASHIDGGPRILLEAMASGKPVLSTEVGFVRDVLGDGMGRIVSSGSVEEMAQGLEALLTIEDAQLQRMGEAGRTHVRVLSGGQRLRARLTSLYAEAATR